jgi:hypothetical protein
MDLASLRKVFRWERLPPPPPKGGGAQRARRAWLPLLLAPEPLPRDPVPAPRARRPGLFAPEHLPLDPPGPPRRGRSHWLRWLLSAEKLDP